MTAYFAKRGNSVRRAEQEWGGESAAGLGVAGVAGEGWGGGRADNVDAASWGGKRQVRRAAAQPRRRRAGRPVGVQRRGAGAGDRRVAGAGGVGGWPRNRLHPRRLRRRPARADAIGGRRTDRKSTRLNSSH